MKKILRYIVLVTVLFVIAFLPKYANDAKADANTTDYKIYVVGNDGTSATGPTGYSGYLYDNWYGYYYYEFYSSPTYITNVDPYQLYGPSDAAFYMYMYYLPAGSTVSMATCTYPQGGQECTVSSGDFSNSGLYCQDTWWGGLYCEVGNYGNQISNGNVVKIVFKVTNERGGVKVNRVGPDNTTGTAPAGTVAMVNSVQVTDNPGAFNSLAASTQRVYTTAISGTTQQTGSCTYADTDNDCSVTSYGLSPTCDASWCYVDVPVTDHTITKVQVKYGTGDLKVVRVGSDDTILTAPPGGTRVNINYPSWVDQVGSSSNPYFYNSVPNGTLYFTDAASFTETVGMCTYPRNGNECTVTNYNTTPTFGSSGNNYGSIPITPTIDQVTKVQIKYDPNGNNGDVQIVRLGGDGTVTTVPANTRADLNQPSWLLGTYNYGKLANPANFYNVSSGTSTAYVGDINLFDETYGICTYPRGGTECTVTSFSTPSFGVSGDPYAAAAIPVISGYVTKVVFKYNSTQTNGDLKVLRVGSDGTANTAPLNTRTDLNQPSWLLGTYNYGKLANPADWSTIANGTNTVYFGDLANFGEVVGICTYPRGGTECTVTNFNITPSYGVSGDPYGAVAVPITGGNVTKVVVKYYNVASTGDVKIKRVGSDGATSTAPLYTRADLNQPSWLLGTYNYGQTTNPANFYNVSSGTSTAYVGDINLFDETYGICTYPRGGTECTVTSFSTPSFGVSGDPYAAAAIPVISGYVTKVVFKYNSTQTNGDLKVLRVGSDGTANTAPLNTRTDLNQPSWLLGTYNYGKLANPADWSTIANGTNTVYFGDLANFGEVVGICTYPRGGTECTVTNFNITPSYGVSGDPYGAVAVPITGGNVTKVVVKYVSGTTNGDLTVTRVGTDNTIYTAPTNSRINVNYPSWISSQGIATNPYESLVNTPGNYAIYFSDLAGSETVGYCQYDRGTTPCTISAYDTSVSYGSSGENYGVATVPITAGKVTRVVVKFPFGTNNQDTSTGNIKVKRVGADDTIYTAPSTSVGVNAANQTSANPGDFINLSSALTLALGDGSGSNNIPTTVGSPSQTTGAVGQGMAFNGNGQYLTVPNSTSLDLANDFTISTWFKTNIDSSGGGTIIVSKHDSGADTGYVFFYYNSRLMLQYGNGGGGWTYVTAASNTVIPVGSWQHVTVVRGGGTVKFYLNGVLDATVSAGSDPIPASGRDMWLAHDVNQSNVSGHLLNGALDEFRMYNRALSGSEVSALYSNSNPTASGMVAYYSMESLSSSPIVYTVYSTDSALMGEVAGTCTYSRGGSECSVTNFNITPTCNGTQCTVPVTVSADTVTKVVFKYTTGQSGDIKVKRVGADDTTLTAPSGNSGVGAANQSSANPADYINNSTVPVGTVSDSAGNSTATIVGTYTQPAGTIGQAIGMSGSQYFTHPTTGMSATQGTFSAWVKPASNTWGLWQTKDSSSVNFSDWIALMAYQDGTFYYRIMNGGTFNDVTFTTSSYLPTNQWANITATWDGTADGVANDTMRIYVNGTQVAARTNANFQSTIDQAARIGYGHQTALNGVIDDVRMYNRPLSAGEVTAIYNKSNPSTAGLVQYYTMDSVATVAPSYTVYTNDVTGFTETAGTCTYNRGANECTVTTFTTPITCNGSQCTVSVTPLENKITKVVFKYFPDNESIGSVRIFRYGPDGTQYSAPSTNVGLDAANQTSNNPGEYTNVATGTHTAYTTDLALYQETVGTCQYQRGETECTVSSFAPPLSCTGTLCTQTFTVLPGVVTKVVYKYNNNTNNGDVKIKRVGGDDTTLTAPSSNSKLDLSGPTSANPADYTSMYTGSHVAYTTDVANYTETAGTCTYARGGTECRITSFTQTPTCDGSYCALSLNVNSGQITKVVFKYTASDSQLPTTGGDIKIKTVGPDNGTLTRPAGISTGLNAPNQTTANPSDWVAQFNGPYLTYATDIPNYTETAGICSFPQGGTECTVTNFNITPTCNGSQCQVLASVTGSNVTKVVFKYVPGTDNIVSYIGNASIRRSVNNDTIGAVSGTDDPGSTQAKNDYASALSGNPASFTNLVVGDHIAYATDKLYNSETAGVCQYTSGATECTVTNYNLTPFCDGTWCRVAYSVTGTGDGGGFSNTNGLQAYYKFDSGDISGTSVTDRSGSGNTATTVNSPTTSTGQSGQAITFNGSNQYLNSSNAMSSTDYTISMWVYENSRASSGDPAYSHMLFTTQSNPYNELASNNGVLYYDIVGSGGWASTGVTIPLQTWTHITVVMNGGTSLKIYKDGQLAFTTGNSGFNSRILPITLGVWTDGGSPLRGFFDGSMDEVRVYNRAFSASDVQQLYTGSADSVPNPSTVTKVAFKYGTANTGDIKVYRDDPTNVPKNVPSTCEPIYLSPDGTAGAVQSGASIPAGSYSIRYGSGGYTYANTPSAPSYTGWWGAGVQIGSSASSFSSSTDFSARYASVIYPNSVPFSTFAAAVANASYTYVHSGGPLYLRAEDSYWGDNRGPGYYVLFCGNGITSAASTYTDLNPASVSSTVQIDSGTPSGANPYLQTTVLAGTHLVYITDNPLMAKSAGTCTYARGGQECTVTNFGILPSCDGTSCLVAVPVTGGLITKLVLQYTPGNYGLSVQDPTVKVSQGYDASTIITATNASTTPLLVSLSADGLPFGAVATFNQDSCFATCDTVLNIQTSSSTPVGTYTITVSGNPSNVITTFDLVVTNQNDAQVSFCWLISDGTNLKTSATGIPAGTFSISLASSFNIAQSTLNTVSLNTQNFTPNTTYFSGAQNNAQCMTISNLPYRHYTYSAASITGTGWGTAKYHDTLGGAPSNISALIPYNGQLFDSNPSNDGARNLIADGDMIFGANGGSRSILILNSYTATSTATSTTQIATCSASYSSAPVGTTVRWSGNVNQTNGYTYTWTGTDGLSGNTTVVSKKYTTAGTKTGTFRVFDNGNEIGTCSKTVNITTSNFIEY